MNMPEDKTKIFKALSDLSRLRILKALEIKMFCVCEIRELLNLANSTVSQHLKILKQSGFIIEEKEGKWVNYKINVNPKDKRVSSIIANLDFWINDKNIIVKDLKTVKKLNREIICKTL